VLAKPSPNSPEDQSQEQDRHPLAYDYNRQGTIIAFMLIPYRGPGEAVTWTPFVARGSEEIVG
jgi:hypothetical protein